MSEIFPTIYEVENADREQIAWWYWFLPRRRVPSEQKIIDRIVDRFLNMGGMTPGLLRRIAGSRHRKT